MELEHYMLHLQGENVCIFGLAEVLSPQVIKKIGPANGKSAKAKESHLWKVRKSNILFKGTQD